MPTIIPLFPLPNLVLFPDVEVPLHIFEPRYREMVSEVVQTDRLIGIMLLKGEWERDYYRYPDIFEIGCAGRIGQMTRLADGRFNLTLKGASEFRVIRELRERSYRQAEVQWRPCQPQALAMDQAAMEKVRELLFAYVGEPARQAWRTVVDQRGLRHAELLNFLCFHLDLNPLEKQTLLEAGDRRVACLLDVLTFKLEERKLGPGGAGGSGIVQ